ncbi:hypothetical protein [Plebeiibacterium sediminum]|uniref:Uncharacterized protein n=1 Tax=Plebeiibacterium sediminum TaxID=2992112 RepID=A0AAE3M2B7_9BACT|nr:hypothetical protein [Plebeiobacterium sediminum]MCW3785834.1 hypothetical protein [Plebeiobacterium sediminum]
MRISPETGEVIFEQPINSGTQFDFVDQVLWTTKSGKVDTGRTYRKQYYSAKLNYAHSFGVHNVTALGLFSREKNARGNEFARYREDWVFRLTYDYNKKYMFEANGAYNGSEKFGPGYRFDFFPSLSAGWMLSEESFMKTMSFIDMFKIRGSWGRIGDDAIGGRFLYADQWVYGNHAFLGSYSNTESIYTYFTNSRVGNPNISWETVEKRNIGVDYAFLGGLIAGSFDYFNDYRSNILLSGGNRAIPSFFGGKPSDGNFGEVKASGYEFEVRLSKQIRELRLWANVNMTHATNKVEFADDTEFTPEYQKSEGYTINQVRSYIDSGFLSSWDDVLGSTVRQEENARKLAGDYNIIDFNGDGLIDQDDRAPYGFSGIPQNTYSATLGVDWKGLNFSMQFYGVSNVTREVNFPTFYETKDIAYDEGTYWTVDEGGDVPLPRWIANKASDARGTRYWYDGSYVRLKTAELGYTFKKGWTKLVGMNSCKLYVSGNNLFLWTDMPDDRESNTSGQNSRNGAYPTMSRVTFGVDITF